MDRVKKHLNSMDNEFKKKLKYAKLFRFNMVSCTPDLHDAHSNSIMSCSFAPRLKYANAISGLFHVAYSMADKGRCTPGYVAHGRVL